MGITALQSRMARAALGWSVRDTAANARIGVNTLCRFEGGGEAYISTATALRAAYAAAGVQFSGEGSASYAGLGVQLAGVDA